MKINQKDSSKTSGSNDKNLKSSKKSKETKKSPEKVLHKVANFSAIISKQKDKKFHGSDRQSPTSKSDNVKSNLKEPQLEKRKEDGTEWKALKKIDYQRLETVLEEGQLSSGETSSKHNCDESAGESCTDNSFSNIGPLKTKKSSQNVKPFNEQPEEDEEHLQSEARVPSQYSAKQYRTHQKQQQQQLIKRQLNSEKQEKIMIDDSHGEPADSKCKELNEKFAQTKRSIILNGIEILPIFSNDKFVCSRDAISVEDCEELESLDKNISTSIKTLSESKSAKDTDLISVKPSFSTNSVKKESFSIRRMENLGDCKEANDRKFRYKVLTDRNINQKTSSPFIDSLLILTSFADERKRLTENNNIIKENIPAEVPGIQEDIEGENFSILKIFYAVVVTIFGLLSVFIGIAWRFYEPPCLLDYILEFFPFIHRRRTYIQLFFDQLIKILNSAFGGLRSSESV